MKVLESSLEQLYANFQQKTLSMSSRSFVYTSFAIFISKYRMSFILLQINKSMLGLGHHSIYQQCCIRIIFCKSKVILSQSFESKLIEMKLSRIFQNEFLKDILIFSKFFDFLLIFTLLCVV